MYSIIKQQSSAMQNHSYFNTNLIQVQVLTLPSKLHPQITFFFPHRFSSVAQSCPTLCDPMNLNTPGLPVHHQLPEFTQTHVHRVHDAIQPSHPLSSPSPPAPNPSQHHGLFQWVSSAWGGQSIGVSASGSVADYVLIIKRGIPWWSTG